VWPLLVVPSPANSMTMGRRGSARLHRRHIERSLDALCGLLASLRAMGYRKVVTYTLKTEPGTSLLAAGWRVVGEVRKRSWDTPSRPRVDRDERQERFRWELVA